VRSTDHKAPCYVVFSSPVLPQPSETQISTSALYSQNIICITLLFDISIINNLFISIYSYSRPHLAKACTFFTFGFLRFFPTHHLLKLVGSVTLRHPINSLSVILSLILNHSVQLFLLPPPPTFPYTSHNLISLSLYPTQGSSSPFSSTPQSAQFTNPESQSRYSPSPKPCTVSSHTSLSSPGKKL
jgi:hypothetical protein